ELAKRISSDYKNRQPTFISILKGSVVFLSDLLRNLDIHCLVDFVAISSYGGETESSGVVRQLLDLRENPVGKDLIVVDDIVDTGLTLSYLRNNLMTRHPASLKICVLLDKKKKRKIDVPIDYTGFVIPDKFVVGYGLDYQEKYRNLPYVGVLNPEVYKK
ncbi:MAG: hypoxanthine phosphoribosyltransferase, partial [Elusimicrobia bacterium]|nr:hypoxanthine phosphoribosyltransferase [Elusimicrobiota bacterium]